MYTEPAKIRRFLNESFSEEELNNLAFDYFPDVYSNTFAKNGVNRAIV